jgi:hypothetical protein
MGEDASELLFAPLFDCIRADFASDDRPNNATPQGPPHASPSQGPGPVLPPPSGMSHRQTTRQFALLTPSQVAGITRQTPRRPTTRISPHFQG